MKKTAIPFATAISFAIALFCGLTLSLAAQQASAGADQSAAASAAHTQVDQSAAAHGAASSNISPLAYDYMRPVNCELAGKLDSKSAKVGEAVIAKTKESVRTADGTVIPKGAKLIGHIADVQAHTSSQAESHLSIAFDRAEWSGGHSLPIHSVIQAVTPPVNAFASEPAENNDSLAGPIGGGGARGVGTARGGGGVLGGAAGAAGSATGNLGSNLGSNVGANASNLGANADGSLRAAGQAAGNVAANTTAVASTGVSAATSASMGAHATGVPGVMLAGDATGATAGTLSASKRNVHLDSGTQLTIAVSGAVSQ